MDNSTKLTVYTPEAGVRHPGKLVKDVISDLPQTHSLAYRLFLRNIKGMYRQSVLGLFWTILPPVITSLIWIFLNGQKVVQIEVPGIPYPLFVLTGTLLWQTFSESVNAPIRGVLKGKSMLAKINFPRESLLLAGMYEVFYNLIIKIVLLGAIFIAFQQVPGWSTLAGLSGFLALALLGAAIGVILTPVAMLYLDVQKAIAVVLQFAIYLTPVIYPEPKGGIAEAIMKFNPVAPVLTTARQWLLDVPVGDVSSFFTIVAVAFVLLALGIFSFRLAMPIIIERIGS